MMTQLDLARVGQTVGECFRCGTLSYRWEGNELLFNMVENMSIHDLK